MAGRVLSCTLRNRFATTLWHFLVAVKQIAECRDVTEAQRHVAPRRVDRSPRPAPPPPPPLSELNRVGFLQFPDAVEACAPIRGLAFAQLISAKRQKGYRYHLTRTPQASPAGHPVRSTRIAPVGQRLGYFGRRNV